MTFMCGSRRYRMQKNKIKIGKDFLYTSYLQEKTYSSYRTYTDTGE